MPLYEYECKSCHTRFDHLARTMSSDAKVKCPKCESANTSRAISVFAVGGEGAGKSQESSGPGMCGRCGGPGPCGME